MSVHHELPPEIVVRDLPDGVRYELPLRHWGMWRWFGWVCAVVSVASVIGLSLAITQLIRSPGQFPQASLFIALGVVVIGIVALYCTLSTLCSWSVIEARETSIMRREHAGIFFRTRRRKLEHVTRLTVAIDSTAKEFDEAMLRRLGNMTYTLTTSDDDTKPFRIARWYPKDLLVPLAHNLARRIGELQAHHFGRAQPIEVEIPAEQVIGESEAMDLTPVAPPKKTDIAIERTADRVSIIVPPLRLIGGPGQSLTRLTVNGLGAAAIGLFIYSWIFGGFGSIMSWVFLLLAFPAMGSWVLFLGERVGERETYIDIVGDVMMISGKSIRGVRVRQWSRDQIADIRCGDSTIEIDDKALPQLQIITADVQKHAYFTGRTREELRWLAWQIRAALHGRLTPSDAGCDDAAHHS